MTSTQAGADAPKGSAEEMLRGLIARCESAVGPDVGLDIQIFRAVNPTKPTHSESTGEYLGRPYTASIDAALTLVPEEWRVEHIGEQLSGGRWDVELHWREYSMEDCIQSEGSTAALALCIAALKGRLAEHLQARKRPLHTPNLSGEKETVE
ncbi:hypothetical protein UFOVP1169_41 [uncultured Caudovirales phage]|uniref:Uncharacterized protein n=1 Tax=uncultured Caudovirales phage TaxID=2100421 RepID=A0A6J5R5J9_9CAUD|nr:hypothetical protein UFOVP1169_41 [uncultured Caudovirales phage]